MISSNFSVTTGKGKNAKPVADQPCWFDLKRNDCAKCKPGGVQCGAPMEKVTTVLPYLCLRFQTVFVIEFANCVCICVEQICVQWCQSKKSKTGCPGIPQFKYTRSSTGFPCYWDPKRLFFTIIITTIITIITITITITMIILSLECAWCVTNMVQCGASE